MLCQADTRRVSLAGARIPLAAGCMNQWLRIALLSTMHAMPGERMRNDSIQNESTPRGDRGVPCYVTW